MTCPKADAKIFSMKRTSSPEDVQVRRDDIVSACESLFGVFDYQDINLKTISERTQLSRPSIYNYFRTKEEIFLALTERYLVSFMTDIEKRLLDRKHDRDEIAHILSEIIQKHFKLIEIFSVHMTDLETHTPIESLVHFKMRFKEFIDLLKKAMLFQYPDADEDSLDFFWESFVASLHGIYPMTTPCKEQKEAMKRANIALPLSKKEFIERTMRLLLSIF